jgi:hypothetical protein
MSFLLKDVNKLYFYCTGDLKFPCEQFCPIANSMRSSQPNKFCLYCLNFFSVRFMWSSGQFMNFSCTVVSFLVAGFLFLCRIFKLPFITLLTLFHVLEIFPEIISRTWNVPRNFCVQWRVSVCTHRANVAQGLYVAIYCFACSSLYLTCYVLSIFQFLQQAHKF